MQEDKQHAGMRPQEPLTHEEMAPLWRWERQVSWLNVGAMGALLLAGIAGQREGEVAWFARPLLVLVLVLMVAAVVLQYRARCPRCRAGLRSKILRTLPDKCGACGVVLPRPPKAGS